MSICGRAGRSSALIFDFFTNEYLRSPEAKRVRRILQVIGEEQVFGIDEGGVEDLLSRRGFCDVHDVDAAGLKRLYFSGPNANRPVRAGANIASARVQHDPA